MKEFILSKKFGIKLTNHNKESINNWIIKQKIHNPLFNELNYKFIMYEKQPGYDTGYAWVEKLINNLL